LVDVRSTQKILNKNIGMSSDTWHRQEDPTQLDLKDESKYRMCDLESFGSGEDPVMDFCQDSMKLSLSIECEKFRDQFRDCQFIKKKISME
jgi:hypothetical protein